MSSQAASTLLTLLRRPPTPVEKFIVPDLPACERRSSSSLIVPTQPVSVSVQLCEIVGECASLQATALGKVSQDSSHPVCANSTWMVSVSGNRMHATIGDELLTWTPHLKELVCFDLVKDGGLVISSDGDEVGVSKLRIGGPVPVVCFTELGVGKVQGVVWHPRWGGIFAVWGERGIVLLDVAIGKGIVGGLGGGSDFFENLSVSAKPAILSFTNWCKEEISSANLLSDLLQLGRPRTPVSDITPHKFAFSDSGYFAVGTGRSVAVWEVDKHSGLCKRTELEKNPCADFVSFIGEDQIVIGGTRDSRVFVQVLYLSGELAKEFIFPDSGFQLNGLEVVGSSDNSNLIILGGSVRNPKELGVCLFFQDDCINVFTVPNLAKIKTIRSGNKSNELFLTGLTQNGKGIALQCSANFETSETYLQPEVSPRTELLEEEEEQIPRIDLEISSSSISSEDDQSLKFVSDKISDHSESVISEITDQFVWVSKRLTDLVPDLKLKRENLEKIVLSAERMQDASLPTKSLKSFDSSSLIISLNKEVDNQISGLVKTRMVPAITAAVRKSLAGVSNGVISDLNQLDKLANQLNQRLEATANIFKSSVSTMTQAENDLSAYKSKVALERSAALNEAKLRIAQLAKDDRSTEIDRVPSIFPRTTTALPSVRSALSSSHGIPSLIEVQTLLKAEKYAEALYLAAKEATKQSGLDDSLIYVCDKLIAAKLRGALVPISPLSRVDEGYLVLYAITSLLERRQFPSDTLRNILRVAGFQTDCIRISGAPTDPDNMEIVSRSHQRVSAFFTHFNVPTDSEELRLSICAKLNELAPRYRSVNFWH